ncbi:MAG: hypothetical protein QE285_14555 [Aquabacterium sp.]|nr:hypothetical protein [Aquabacterium sp.]
MVTGRDRIKTLPWNHLLLHVPVAAKARGGARADEVVIGELDFRQRELHQMAPM